MKNHFVFKSIIIISLFILLIFPSPAGAQETPVKVGVYQNPPLVSMDDEGIVQGLYIDIIENIAFREGWEMDYVPCSFARCLEKLERNEIDILVAVAYSEERSEKYDFNQETVISNWGLVHVQKGSEVHSFLDLEDKRIIVLKDDIHYTGDQGIRNLLSQFNVNSTFIEVDEYTKVFKGLESGEGDAGVVNRFFASKYEQDYSIDRTPIIFNPIEARFAFTKNGDRTAGLIERIDHHMVILKQDKDSIYYQSLQKNLGGENDFEIIPLPVKQAGTVIIILLFFFFSLNIYLRREVKAKTRELLKKNLELETEIDERLAAEKTMKASTEKYSKLVESANDAIFIADAETGIIIDVNKKAEKLLGIPADKIIGKHQTQLHPEGEGERYGKIFKDHIEKGGAISEEIFVCHKDGHLVPVEISASLADVGDRRIVQGIFRDISKRKKAQKDLEKAYQELKSLDVLKTDIVSNVSHELKTPLTIMQGSIELAIEEEELEEVRFLLGKAHSAIKRQEAIINDLIAVGEMSLEKAINEENDLIDLIGTVVKEKSSMAKANGIELAWKKSGDIPILQFDREKIGQVLMNLMDNAIKFNKDGGRVDILAEMADEFVKVSVTDTGIGIKEEDMDKLFQPLTQLDPSSKRKYGGTGTGLAVGKRIIMAHRGRIWAESEFGRGSSFIFTLPLEKK